MAVIYGTIGPDTKWDSENDTVYGWAGDGNDNSVSGDDKLYGQVTTSCMAAQVTITWMAALVTTT